jgi:hypothetical protein
MCSFCLEASLSTTELNLAELLVSLGASGQLSAQLFPSDRLSSILIETGQSLGQFGLLPSGSGTSVSRRLSQSWPIRARRSSGLSLASSSESRLGMPLKYLFLMRQTTSRWQSLQHLISPPKPRPLPPPQVTGHAGLLIEHLLRPFAGFGVAPLRGQQFREIQVCF